MYVHKNLSLESLLEHFKLQADPYLHFLFNGIFYFGETVWGQ